jgi:hypothetical protein
VLAHRRRVELAHDVDRVVDRGRDKWLTSTELRLTADIPLSEHDPWDGWFITDGRGRFPTSKSLGRLLTGQIDRYRGSYVLRSEQDKHSKVRTWRIEEWSA